MTNGLTLLKRTLQNRDFVQILTPKAFGINQNPWFFKALLIGK